MNKQKLIVEAWRAGIWTEENVTRAFECSYLEFRTALLQAGLQVPTEKPIGLLTEIYREFNIGADDRYENAEWVSKAYGISRSSAIRHCNNPPDNLVRTAMPIEDIKTYYEAGFDIITIGNLFDVPVTAIRKALNIKRAIISEEVKEAIVCEIEDGTLHRDIALKYGVSESTVSSLNPNKIHKTRRQGLEEKEWQDLKVSLNSYSISELSRLYNISRGYIYARLAKEKDD